MKQLIFYLILFSSLLISQDLPSDKYWRIGESSAICVYGDTLLSQNGNILELHNIVDKSNPKWISSIQLPNKFNKIETWNNYAFCLLSSGQLAVIDLKNSLSLNLIDLFNSDISDFTFYGDKLILAQGEYGFSIYDLTNILVPVEIEKHNFPDSYFLSKVNYTQEYLYFSCKDKIIIFDNSNFPRVSLVKIINLNELFEEEITINSIIPVDKYVYTSLYNKGIVTIDLSDTSNVVTSIKKYGGSNDESYQNMILHEDYLFVATCFYQSLDINGLDDHFGDGIHVFDISNKSIPNDYCKIYFTDYYRSDSFMMALSNDGNTLLSTLGFFNGFRCIDISQLSDSKEICMTLNPSIKDISFIDNIIYYAGGKSGLGILNNSPEEVTEIKRIVPNGAVTTVKNIENYLFVGIDSIGIQIYTLDDPKNPEQISLISAGQPNFVYADKFMFTWDAFSIKIYDTSDLINPAFLNEFCNRNNWGEQIANVYYFQDFIVVVPNDDSENVEIFDITDLKNPRSVYQMELKNYSFSKTTFQKTNDYLYINEYYNNYIYSIADLNNIQLVYTNYFPLQSNAVILGDTLYLQSENLSIYRISDFSNPQLLSKFDFPLSWNFFLDDDILFHRNGPYGINLEIYSINTINDVELLHSFPISEEYLNLKHSYFYNNELINIRSALGIEIFNVKNITKVEKIYHEEFPDYDLINYPNPFNSSTIINYSLPKSKKIKIYLYNVLGKEIDKLVDNYKEAGFHSIKYNANHLSSGVYFFRLLSNSKSIAKKMLIIK